MLHRNIGVVLLFFSAIALALRYDSAHDGWNLNENKTALDPVHYAGSWSNETYNHTYNPSPTNWRMPFYVLTLDRYIDGDPTNNEANGTNFEHDWQTNQFRFGGDAKGLMNNLDYIQGMGIKALYMSGTPFINMPWASDGFGPLDFTLLDHHHGTIQDWRNLITEIHRRNMYIVLDNTIATMGDLFSFKGYENVSTPFSFNEYDVVYKSDRQYLDFSYKNEWNASCQYPRLWQADGYPMANASVLDGISHGCMDSEFDQYGDIAGVGEVPVWENQLGKFASVQDRLRSWRQDVLDKINVFSCMQISMLDIDGFRIDKAAQTPIDVFGNFSDYQRTCAKQYGKENFLIVGEVVSKTPYASLIIGRGKEPQNAWDNFADAVAAKDVRNSTDYIREFGHSALDGDAFHYPTYGGITRFLGLDGPIGLEGVNFVEIWHDLVRHEDMVNANTAEFDPRHMFGMTNQDVFRWPGLKDGIQRHLLGLLINYLQMPGIPFHLWGEEQMFYVLENQAADYVFGRTPMGSSRAWQLHGCYKIGQEVYVNQPFDSANRGCEDDSVSLDHRDPSHPIRNIIKRMYELREQYPVLNDGFTVETLMNRTQSVYLPGSLGMPSPTGLWSIYRGRTAAVQDLQGGQGNQSVWLVYHNNDTIANYTSDCNSSNYTDVILSAFPGGTTVKNLFYPYEEYTLENSTIQLGIDGETETNGCLTSVELAPYGFKAFVPVETFEDPRPTITKVVPGHDERLVSTTSDGTGQVVPFEIHFSTEMNCDSLRNNISISSTTNDASTPTFNKSSVTCHTIDAETGSYVGYVAGTWVFKGEFENVSDGIHVISIKNVTNEAGNQSTNAYDAYMFRIGQRTNPMVFPGSSNYSTSLLNRDDTTGDLYVAHNAAGANRWQYSLNWATSWSDWIDYEPGNTTIDSQAWSGSKAQTWDGHHIMIRYWSELAGSMEHVQHGDLDFSGGPRQWPHMHVTGPWNLYGYDAGLEDSMSLASDSGWEFDLMVEWPSQVILSTWGINPDGQPDLSKVYGDVDGDNILDWLPPTSLSDNVVNISGPSMPYTGVRIIARDSDLRYILEPVGSAWKQLAIWLLLGIIPVLTAVTTAYLFVRCFYHVKFNELGIMKKSSSPTLGPLPTLAESFFAAPGRSTMELFGSAKQAHPMNPQRRDGFATTEGDSRKTVLIATMEYEIEDWAVKIKIGGLGVMASLMGKNLQHQNLIWVVPCVGGIEYPTDQTAEPMTIKIMDQDYTINVQYHALRNITYVLLDSPIFRGQTKADPYPARMDDMESAVYYSAWNQCIAEAVRRFPEIDLYHINDYHGSIAPLYLLPDTIPVALSLHNAEFQGLWSVKTPQALKEICRVFNLSKDVVSRYVQFGEVFNLLHAGASYLRLHQKGYGAVGVSTKYGKRSFARYPIFWGLPKIGALPNPDPTDTAAWNKTLPHADSIAIDQETEQQRGALRTQAQEWAGLKVDPHAELFVFVGRWSLQKGVDLISDVMPSVLEKNPNVQLICIGPVIDLNGKFAALKLQKLMEMYPDRVCSKPEFTMLPPYIFSGAEFALIPSRDEPFGLVAVEFGRKGALGVGSRVGGLGQMPGFWFTIESNQSKHLIRQFKAAIKAALECTTENRAMMRARSAVQRFPVAQWVEGLEELQGEAIRMHGKVLSRAPSFISLKSPIASPSQSKNNSPLHTPTISRRPSLASVFGGRMGSRVGSRAASPIREESNEPNTQEELQKALSKTKEGRRTGKKARIAPASTSAGSNGNSINQQGFTSLLEPIESKNLYDQQQATNDSSGSSSSSSKSTRSQTDRPSRESDPVSQEEDATRSNSWDFATGSPGRMNTAPTTAANTPGPSRTPSFSFPQNGAQNSYDSLPPSRVPSVLSLSTVVGDEKNYSLQKVDPFFTDAQGYYYKRYTKMLENLSGKTSEGELCVEDYLTKAEKDWFNRMHKAKLGVKQSDTSPRSSTNETMIGEASIIEGQVDEFNLGADYAPPTGVRKLMNYKIRDWPLYAFIIALGQILAANSYQITLIAGEIGQTAEKLYIIASIYLASSILWWIIFRRCKSIWVISTPFMFYGAAFFILGMSPYGSTYSSRAWIQNVATGLYAIASGSGSLFFALNFGSEGGSAVHTWAFRACVIQGTQQIYVTVLWFWGNYLSEKSAAGFTGTMITSTPYVTAVTTPVAVILFACGILLFLGLPDYYRNTPGKVPSFYTSLWRRKIIMWFFVVVLIQNFFLSAPYGRNWRYLWSSSVAPAWAIVILVFVFFILIWAGVFTLFAKLSHEHSWIIPLFAIGLGAPRWAQMLWGTSGMGSWVPWAGSPVAGALLGRGLWLWLGVLDQLQGVGFGMILLQTMTRFHVAFTLIAAQVLGSVATIVARACAPDKLGPGPVFPNLVLNLNGLGNAWFWITIIFQIFICIGFAVFFRKEQLFKP
ncbi:alpha-1,3-glucan synthase Ags2 [Pseudovirgaria hyperparasitica]|uniref:alpha-1,3-glucan synthase n=1 Tax=Pseudovirgaria hyperparasitica TaxID=470096 RepID=A0A6A6WBP0_9PEZI|nr:alpha-1,3-glucan synthase Ags2 [Pseudovirgaria hyperparasitica]KAF2759017.1 alpha-1,3-glucan synthase Ags2 [Pseudovirgaria hyperparasitica]